MARLEGMIALVTAGTSGIGLVTAKLLVNSGAYVFITGVREQELMEAVKEIGSNVCGVMADVSKQEDIHRLIERIKRERGRLDVVFASSGICHDAWCRNRAGELSTSPSTIQVRELLSTVRTALPMMPNGTSLILNAFIVARELAANSLLVEPM
jgi:NAD(P)-dependent dehydrogenase (short-subunit alcohol dehydrogenase family)